MPFPTQEPPPRQTRTAMIGFAVTPHEKRQIEHVARIRKITVSALIRDMHFPEIIAESERLDARVSELMAADAAREAGA